MYTIFKSCVTEVEQTKIFERTIRNILIANGRTDPPREMRGYICGTSTFLTRCSRRLPINVKYLKFHEGQAVLILGMTRPHRVKLLFAFWMQKKMARFMGDEGLMKDGGDLQEVMGDSLGVGVIS